MTWGKGDSQPFDTPLKYRLQMVTNNIKVPIPDKRCAWLYHLPCCFGEQLEDMALLKCIELLKRRKRVLACRNSHQPARSFRRSSSIKIRCISMRARAEI